MPLPPGRSREYNARTCMTDPIVRLFGTPARLKVLRLYLLNDAEAFSIPEAAGRSRIPKDVARRAVAALVGMKILRRRAPRGGGLYTVDHRFVHREALKAFLRATTTLTDAFIIRALRRAGTLQLVILSGLFTGAIESQADIVIVGDRLDERTITATIRIFEAELGKELRYASFGTEDFRYRLGVYDRLIRDVLDSPHRVIFDKIGV